MKKLHHNVKYPICKNVFDLCVSQSAMINCWPVILISTTKKCKGGEKTCLKWGLFVLIVFLVVYVIRLWKKWKSKIESKSDCLWFLLSDKNIKVQVGSWCVVIIDDYITENVISSWYLVYINVNQDINEVIFKHRRRLKTTFILYY